jgi:hypothetical protein
MAYQNNAIQDFVNLSEFEQIIEFIQFNVQLHQGVLSDGAKYFSMRQMRNNRLDIRIITD